MWHPYNLCASASKAFSTESQRRFTWLSTSFLALHLLFAGQLASGQTCVFNSFIRASDNPFASCPPGTDTIIIRDSFLVNVNYEPLIGFVPFEGLLLVDGGTIQWTANAYLKLGDRAKVVLINGGKFRPKSSNAPDCNSFRALYFDTIKVVDCNGLTAPHAFSDVNNAGCVTRAGICCNAYVVTAENSGVPNDGTICQPGDTVRLSVITSGDLNYSILWSPNIGQGKGPHVVTPTKTSSYRVEMSAIFTPYDGTPSYLLTCGGSAVVTLNTPITATATATPVPCLDVPTGALNLTPSGGVAPYTYRWSNGAKTRNLTNVPGGTYTVTITDSKGCTGVHTFKVPVQDNTPPTLTCPPNAVGVANPGTCTTLIANIDATFSDNCPTVGVTYTLTGATIGSGEGQLSNKVPFSSGITTVTYQVDDGANAVTCTFTIRVDDTQPPTADNLPALTGITCLSAVPAPELTAVSASDNCGVTSIVHVSDVVLAGSGCPGDTLQMLRTYRAFDAAGNSATATQHVRVVDNLPPTFTFVPANVAVSCNAIPAVGIPTATDNCSSSITIIYNGETRTDGACPDSYTLRRRWIATDGCGNTATAEQIITVQDSTPPSFTFVPPAVTVSCSAIPGVGTPVASDNCDVSVSIVYNGETRTNGACPDSYTLRRRWTATDNCGNTASAEQVIVVQDFTPPAFTSVPADATVSCDAIPIVGNPVATDNCDNVVSITYDGETRNDGACHNFYTLTRRWTATDNCGNTASATQVLTVRDLTPPTFTNFPANATVSCDAIPPEATPAAADNCAASVTVTYLGESRNDGICPNNYALLRRWQATDACGNTTVSTQTITVRDTEAPVFTFVPANTTTSCEALPPVGNPVATDNCSPAAAINYDGQTRTNGPCPDTYFLTRRWTAADQCGNTRTAEQVITVRDQTPPTFTQTPANITVSCSAIPPVGTAAATDNCDASVTVTYDGQTRLDGACPDNYTLVRRWIAIDNCGNTTSAQQIITVQDINPPAFTFVPPNATVNCEAIPSLGSPAATDNCDNSVTITFAGVTQTSGSCASGGTVTRRWIATDNCGNTAIAEQVLVVQDTTRPVFVFVPANTTVSCENIPAPGLPQATDNCANDVEINYNGETRTNGPCDDTYTLRRRWTATDLCGNTRTAEQVITVRDLTPPAFTFVPPDATVSCDAVPAPGQPSASDNCDASVNIAYLGETRTNGPCPDEYVLVRRWTATDNCGNTASASQRITVRDQTKPVFTSFPNDITVSCESIPTPATPTATDNCAVDVLVSYNGETRLNGPCPHTYTLKRQWTAVDKCSNTASAVQTITVQDLKPPVFTFVPANATVHCDSVPAVGTPIASDNCTSSVTITYNGETRLNGPCANTYELVRRWTATDACGNAQTAEQRLTVQDVKRPVFTFSPPHVTVSCENVPPVATPVAQDNCDATVNIFYEGETRADGACPDTYTLTRRWTAADQCGNTRSVEQIITVRDLTPPAFTAVPANVTVSCENVPAVGTPTATDNCDADVSIAYLGETRTDGPCPDTYTLTRRWRATDNCGNFAVTQQVLTVRDIVAPVFTFVPASVTVSCENVPALNTPTATDNCDANVAIAFLGETRTDGPCPDTYTLTRRWTATDNCGNSTETQQVITVRDLTAPVFTFVTANVTVSCENVPAVATPTATDNCDPSVSIAYLGETRADGPCPNTYTLTRRWTATDNCGNSVATQQIIAVQDLTAPAFTFVPVNLTVSCEAVPAVGAPTATDNCTASVTITFNGETRLNGSCPDTYTLERRWTAADACGNTTTALQTIAVRDVAPPVFTFVPPDATVNCDAIPNIANPIATDNCDANVSISLTTDLQIGTDCASGGVIIRRWTAVDNCGNSAIAEQRLTVQDTTKPVFTFIPANTTVSCAAVPAVGTPTATDNCAANVSITYDGETRANGPCPDTYTLTRRWTARDVCGNTQSAQQIITVRDVEPPSFTFAPADVTVSCDAVPAIGTPLATDNCDANVTIIYNGETRADGACPDAYLLTRRWTATDNCGNTTATLQKIVVRDLVPPVFTAVPANVTVSCESVPPVVSPTATDNCDTNVNIALLGEDRGNGPCPNTYTLTRRWLATDNCGNTATAQQIVVVQDKTPPTFTFVPANATVECSAVPAVATPIASDNCTFAPTLNYLGETRVDGNCPDTYTLIRRWQATDECGNTKTAQQLIFVRDLTPPAFTNKPADVTVSCDAVPAPAQPTATDNCDADVQITYEGQTVVSAPSSGTYLLRRQWTAADNCGNTVKITQNISVKDTAPPSITCPPNVNVPANGATCSQVVTFDPPKVLDNCDAKPSVAGTIISGTALPVGTIVASFLAKDDSGNSATCTFRITVADTTAPKLVNCPKDFTVTTPAGTCETKVFWDDPKVVDACDTYPIVPKPNIPAGSILPTGQTTITYTAQDTTGNKMTCSFVITVKESIPPVLVACPKDITLYTNNCTAVATWTAPQVSDNCSPVTLTCSHTSGTPFPETTTAVTYTATDIWGNTAACSFKVTVIDTVAPKFSGCPKDTVVNSNGACSIAVNWKMPTATDNCAPAPTVKASSMPGDTYPVGHTLVKVTVEDPSGNKDQCTFKITVIGPPLGFENIPANQFFVGCSAVATWVPPTPTGVCAPAKITATHKPGDTFFVGTTVVIYTVIDTLGYSASATFTITVTESIPPVLNCPTSPILVDVSGAIKTDPSKFLTSAQATASCDGTMLKFSLPSATDNCGAPTVEQTGGLKSGEVFPIGTHVLSFRASDPAGNTDACSVTVVVSPLQPLAPQISDKIGCAGDDIVISTPVIPGATYLWTGPKPPYPNSNNLLIENLTPELTGIYTVQAIVNGCYTPKDTALVRIGKQPKAVDDPDFEAETIGKLEGFNVLANDTYEADDFTVTVVGPLAGLTELGNGLFTYQAGPNNGRVNFIYRLCSAACPDLCSDAVVTITVRETFCTYIPNIITPNDDNINDYLEIPCLNTELYPNNRLIIYNQWGDKVYEASPYSNDPAKAWRGTLNGRPGQHLPDGTYFYYFLPAPDRKPLTGYLEIFR
ncbi:MAG: HYR domain-containing protein [Saprospiraceae bacterium]|nr:HYR domain-containing protein [Saprospiraceae bacterium]MDW8484101.1 HYR domain-containing protein [Saprospiraceae bacterium]